MPPIFTGNCIMVAQTAAIRLFAALLVGGFLAGGSTGSALGADEWDPLPILKRLDRDGNGYVTQSEVPAEMRQFVANIVGQAGQNASTSIHLDRLREDWATRRADRGETETVASNSDHLGPVEAVQRARSLIQAYDLDGDGQLQRVEWQRLSPAWGEDDFNADESLSTLEVSLALWNIEYTSANQQQNSTSLQGGAATLAPDVVRLLRASVVASTATSLQSSTRLAVQHERQLDSHERQWLYATELMRLYDRDEDGWLIEGEWNELDVSWGAADRNRDGRLNMEEMVMRFQSLQTAPATAAAEHAESDGADRSADAPEEFAALDRNRDGQVQMHEFAQAWDESIVRRFLKRDGDGDGVVTRSEWSASEQN